MKKFRDDRKQKVKQIEKAIKEAGSNIKNANNPDAKKAKGIFSKIYLGIQRNKKFILTGAFAAMLTALAVAIKSSNERERERVQRERDENARQTMQRGIQALYNITRAHEITNEIANELRAHQNRERGEIREQAERSGVGSRAVGFGISPQDLINGIARRHEREQEQNQRRVQGVGNANGPISTQRRQDPVDRILQETGFAESSRYGTIGAGMGNRVNVLHRSGQTGYTMRGRSPRYIAELRRRNPHAQTPDVGYFGGLELDSGYSVKARKHKDFVLMYGAIINGLISKALARFVSNENLIREIMYGDIQEKTFVRNFVKKFVTEIDYAIKTGGYPDEIVAEKNQFKSALLKATTIKDLLRIFPLNKQLQKIDGLFTEARRRVNR